VISHALAEEYLDLFGALVRGRVTVAPDGADPPNGDGLRPTSAGGLTLGYVGNLYPGKGMEMIAKLAERLPGFRFQVIGGSQPETARWRGRVGAANVVFHGHVPHAEAQARMRACDILLAPFQRAVWIGDEHAEIGRWMSPLKIFEYMASGRPMIASDLPVLREVLRHGANALLVDPEDPEAWVRAIEMLVADQELRHRLAAQARDDLARNYTWNQRAERILAESCGPLDEQAVRRK
jgi:glycosyltransferase involved in cell wall biosynthesis